MKRGNLIGLFTFRESNHGKDVVMPFSEWRDLVGRLNAINATLHLINLKLEDPVTSDELHEVRESVLNVINMGIGDEGFRERRCVERRVDDE